MSRRSLRIAEKDAAKAAALIPTAGDAMADVKVERRMILKMAKKTSMECLMSWMELFVKVKYFAANLLEIVMTWLEARRKRCRKM